MGAESFFYNLIPEGVTPKRSREGNIFHGVSNTKASEVEEKLKTKYKLQREVCYWLIDESIMIDIECSEQNIQAISVVGCFSWFEECLEYCYKVSNTVEKCKDGFRYFHPERGFLDIHNVDEFKEIMLDIYGSKYHSFINTFGYMNKKLAPGKVFYGYLRKRRSPIYRIRLLLKSIFKGI